MKTNIVKSFFIDALYAIMAGVPAKKIGHIDRETGEYVYEK